MAMDAETARMLDWQASRYFGKYRGIVTDVRDPKSLGRVRARVPDVLADEQTGWALPSAPYAGPSQGLFAVPPPGAGVWIEFEAGDVSRPIWAGCWWRGEQAPEKGSPSVKVLRTGSGHSITLEDTDGDEKIVITDAHGSKVIIDEQTRSILPFLNLESQKAARP